jgi:dethiobiotin synthetase
VKVVVVTGTSTGVGKTVTTAALAVTTPGAVVVKPVQTGAADGDSDAREVHRLSGAEVQEWTTLEEPLAPDTAARRQGVPIPTVATYAERLLALPAETVVVEGAGGLLVHLDADGGTLLDLAALLRAGGADVELVVVVAAGLGTLNHTELTLDALRAQDLAVRGLVVGSWPESPGLAERCNLEDLPRFAPLLGVLPAGAGALDRAAFVAAAPGWLSGPGAPRRTGSS